MLATLITHGTLRALDYTVVGLYVVATLAVGMWFGRRRQDAEEYLLGGRSILWWVAGISYLMTLLSTVSMVGVPGEAYDHGITLSIQNLILPFVAIAGFHLFVRFYFKAKMFTPFDYLERRFDPRVRAGCAGFYWVERMIYLGLVMYATAIIFEGACGWPKHWTILLTAGVAVTYTLIGGLKAVAWTELVQFVIIVGGMGILISKILRAVPGGAVGVIRYAFEHGRGMPQLHDPTFYSLSPFYRLTLWGLVLFVVNEQLFFNSADQIAIQRYLSTANYKQAKRSMFTFVALVVPASFALWFLGLAIFSFYATQSSATPPARGDLALYEFISTYLPTPVRGLIIAALLAKGMSTLAGGLNSLSTVATVDGYRRFFNPSARQHQQVTFSRWMTLAIGALAGLVGVGLSRLSDETGGTVMETSFVFLSLWVALAPVFLLGVLSRRATGTHALTALAIGCSITAGMIIYHLLSKGSRYELSFMYVGVPGPILALAVGFVLSRFSPRRTDALGDLTLWTLRTEPSAESQAQAATREKVPTAV